MSEKTLLVLCPYFPPECVGGANYLRTLCNGLESNGWKIIALPSQPMFPYGSWGENEPWVEKQGSLKIARVPSLPLHRPDPPAWARILHLITYGFFSVIMGLYYTIKEEPDAVLASTPPDISLVAGWIIHKLTRIQLYLSFRDNWLENAISLGFIGRKSPIAEFARWLRAEAVRDAASLLVTTPELIDEMEGIEGCPQYHIIPNGFSEARVNEIPLDRDKTRLVYLGNIGHAYEVELLVRSLDSLPKAFSLHIIGDGDCRNDVIDLVTGLGLEDRVTIETIEDRDRLFNVLSNAGIGLIPLKENNSFRGILPIKAIEYMACGLPYVASGTGRMETLIEESSSGVHVPLDADAIAQEILNLAYDPELYRLCSSAGQAYSKRFTLESIGKRVDEILESPSEA